MSENEVMIRFFFLSRVRKYLLRVGENKNKLGETILKNLERQERVG